MKLLQKRMLVMLLTLLMVLNLIPLQIYAHNYIPNKYYYDQLIDEVNYLAESLSLLPEFTNATDPTHFIDPWSVMVMSAYGKADKLTEKHIFLVNSINMAKSNPNSAPLAISLTSLGYDATNFHIGNGNYINIIETISNHNKNHDTPTLGEVNSYIFALKAYDSGNYILPEDAYWTRQVIVEHIIKVQDEDGGWSFSPIFGTDYDLTAMAISALIPYKDNNIEVSLAIDKAVNMLSKTYKDDGGFYSWGSKNSNSASMVIVALSGLGINAHTNPLFIKDGVSLLDYLLTFKTDDNRFGATNNTSYDAFATEQAFRALVSYSKFMENGGEYGNGYNIYSFGDTRIEQPSTESITGDINVNNTETKIEGFIDIDSDAVLNFETLTDDNSKVARFPQVSVNKFINNTRSVRLEIEKDTIATGISGWDGVFKFPTIVQNPTIPNYYTSQLAIKVGTDNNLTFNKPVRILLPDIKGKEIGYIDHNGELHQINNILNLDTKESLGTNRNGKIEVGNDVAIWTTHFTTFVAYSNNGGGGVITPNPEEPPTQPQDTTINVSMTIIGDNNIGTIFNQNVEIEENSTVFDLLMKVSNEQGISVSYVGNNESAYVRGINGLFEFDRGPLSGWVFRVNGNVPNVGAGVQNLNNGDNVLWYYTQDFTQEDVNFPNPNPVKPPNSEGLDTTDTSYMDMINEEYANPLTSISKTSTIINRMINYYISKTYITDWEALSIVLTGNKLNDNKKQELIERVISINGDFRVATDAARIAILLQLSGVDITDIDGINLLEKIYNNNNMGRQGLNGYLFSLIVITNAKIAADAIMNSNIIIETILSYQNLDGGFPLSLGGVSNMDITAMAMTALAPYNDIKEVQLALDKALTYLINNQESDGTFKAWGEKSSETISQVIIALTSNGINPDHESFIKNNKTLMEVLLTYQTSDNKFAHIPNGDSNDIATEQAILAIISYNRFFANEQPIYIINKDTFTINNDTLNIIENKTEELEANKLNFIDMDDISVWAINYVNKAISLGLILGNEENLIKPKENITRAEFVKLLIDVMGELPKQEFNGTFNDVKVNRWYAPYVEKAAELGIVRGTGNQEFFPQQSITRQDMAVVIANAYNLKGEPQLILDAVEISPYALDAIEAVLENGLMLGVGDNYFNPMGTVTREMAITIMVRILENI